MSVEPSAQCCGMCARSHPWGGHGLACLGHALHVVKLGQPCLVTMVNAGIIRCHAPVPRRGMLGLQPSVVVLPEAVHEPTKQLLHAFEALDGGTLECSFVPLSPGGCTSSPSSMLSIPLVPVIML